MARCNLCEKKYKHNGNTTNLRQHLTRKHFILYTTSDVSINQEKQQTESSSDVDDISCSSPSSSSTVSNKRRKLKFKVHHQNIYFYVSLQMHKLQVKPYRDVRIDTAFQRASSFAG